MNLKLMGGCLSNVIALEKYRKVDIPRDAMARVEILSSGRLHITMSASDSGIVCEESNLPKWFKDCFLYLKERVSSNEEGTVSVEFGMRIADNLFYISCKSC